MSLPADKTPWPPQGNAERYGRMARPDAWYKGTPEALGAVYGSYSGEVRGGPATTLNPQGAPKQHTAGMGANRNEFWQNNAAEEVNTKRHLGVAQDIATFSSENLFSERLQIRVKGPVQPQDGPAGPDGVPAWLKGDPAPETLAAQRRLDRTLSLCGFDSTLLAAAEIGAVLGSTGLRIAFNKTGAIKDRPVIARVDADAAIPVYSWGQLVGVMFWQVVQYDKGGVIWRHIELHEGGVVYHGLYKGDADNIGERQELSAIPGRADLVALDKATNDEGAISLLADGGRTATSIPNMLPDPLDRSSHSGRSDFTPAVMDLFDSIDRLFSQMMDTIEDAKSRLIVAASMLENAGPGKGSTFDINQRVFTKVKVPPAEKEGGGLPIEKIQFEMHIEEYLRGLDWLINQAIHEAGYTASQDAGDPGRDITATEINSNDARTMATRDKKIRYWQPELEALLTSFLAIDVQEFAPRDAETNQAVKAYPVEVTFPDAVQPTKLELANVAKALKDADAASLYERVKTVNPDWTDRQINTDVERKRAESAVVDPVTFGMAGAGVGPGDGV